MGALTRALRLLLPEAAHRLTVGALRLADPILPVQENDDSRLGVKVLGIDFPNPVGIAAGFDKNAEIPDALLKLGFGFAECGTLTPRPQKGNPRPRVFRLTKDRAVINRLGFNNCGMEAAARRLEGRRGGVVGINIGPNADSPDRIADYVSAFSRLARFASYIAINVSSPNTPGLRGLQTPGELERLFGRLSDARMGMARAVPLLLKIAPDLDHRAMDDISAICTAFAVDGLIVTNTTVSRSPNLKSPLKNEPGGLSGAPLFSLSTSVLRAMRQRLGMKSVLIGVGGISSGADAYAKIRAGASLVQLYTAFVYEGPGLIPRIKSELLSLLLRDGFACVSDAVGVDLK
ncbi:MAG: quinone-dependent dihydroorotate dehydrogenase [Alphaproteobacteria bacterium]